MLPDMAEPAQPNANNAGESAQLSDCSSVAVAQ